jgi:hypothetical protein
MTHNYLELCDYGFPSKPRIDLFVEKLKTCCLQIHIDNPHPAKSCDMLKIRPKNRYFSNLEYLATICNSMIIEMYNDMIRISDCFEGCQTFRFIAVALPVAGTLNTAVRATILDTIKFFSLSIFQLCWLSPVLRGMF